jgi:hypothetical protein
LQVHVVIIRGWKMIEPNNFWLAYAGKLRL